MTALPLRRASRSTRAAAARRGCAATATGSTRLVGSMRTKRPGVRIRTSTSSSRPTSPSSLPFDDDELRSRLRELRGRASGASPDRRISPSGAACCGREGRLVLLTSNRANPLWRSRIDCPSRLRLAIKRRGAGAAERDVYPTQYLANTPTAARTVLRLPPASSPSRSSYVGTLHRYGARVPGASAASSDRRASSACGASLDDRREPTATQPLFGSCKDLQVVGFELGTLGRAVRRSLASSAVVALAAVRLSRAAAAATTQLFPGVTYETGVQFTPHGPVAIHVVRGPRPVGLHRLRPVLSNETVVRPRDRDRRCSAGSPRRRRWSASTATSSRWADGRPSGILLRDGVLASRPERQPLEHRDHARRDPRRPPGQVLRHLARAGPAPAAERASTRRRERTGSRSSRPTGAPRHRVSRAPYARASSHRFPPPRRTPTSLPAVRASARLLRSRSRRARPCSSRGEPPRRSCTAEAPRRDDGHASG